MNKNAIIVPNPKKDDGLVTTREVAKKLSSLGFSLFIDEIYEKEGKIDVTYYRDPPAKTDFIVVVGGDGSFIDASVLALSLDAPIFGVNLGRVGYLSEVEPSSLSMLDSLVTGNCEIKERMLLSIEKTGENETDEVCPHLAINDIVVSHKSYFGIAEITLENSGGEILKMRSDGVIVSTPSGSTAYSLSAGGPVVAQSLDSLIVTPVCPHSFFNRSLIYSPEECIKISNTSISPLNISVDGRYFTHLSEGESCIVKKSDRRLKVVCFSSGKMFSTLFKKIKILDHKD